MRRLQTDQQDQARRARMRTQPRLDTDDDARADARAATVRAAARQVTERAARFLATSQAP